MGWRAIASWLTDVGELESAAGRAIIAERFSALQQQVPLLYTVALTNLIGIYLATGGTVDSFLHPMPLLICFVLLRLVHWARVRSSKLDSRRLAAELRKSWRYALLISAAFGAWALYLLSSRAADPTIIVLFASLAAIGCSYALSSFPSAARLPLLLLALPVAGYQIFSADTAQVGTGISLGLLTILVLRLIDVHEKSFTQLVWSRAQIAEERERSNLAEQLAEAAKHDAIQLADTDSLTGLLNRRAFVRELTAILAKGEGGAALALIDLNGFKPINDTFGHPTGDAVLQSIADRIAQPVQGAMLAARIGGDEFALLIRDCFTAERAQLCGNQICAAVQAPVKIGDREFHVGLSCGVAIVHDCDASEALFRADAAMYRAKRECKGGAVIYSPELDEVSRRRAVIEETLRSRSFEQEMRLVFQPICDLSTGELRAFEALARWDHGALGPVSPAEFIPIAEHINAIGAITEELLRSAANQARRWPDAVKLSFNVSAVQLCARGSSGRLLAIIEEAGLHPTRLQVELTETALLADYEVARANLHALRSTGARILLDDFGAGHASVSYLREMQFDGLKLDGSFVSRISDSLRAQRLLTGVLGLSASMGLSSIAEHIATEEQLRFLRDHGCSEGQGFFISRPLEPEQAARLAEPTVLPWHSISNRLNRVA